MIRTYLAFDQPGRSVAPTDLSREGYIEILRGNGRVIERRRRTPDAVATTWITACELAYGAAQSRAPEANQALVVAFLATLPILELDGVAAEHFGRLKADLERAGTLLADATC
jgi:tRNA(fMet)-specific endonuclease VapC